jgi:hypothetical protein
MPEPSRCIWAAIMLGFFMGCMPAMGLPLLLRVSQWLRMGGSGCREGVRSVVLQRCPLQLVRRAVGHLAVPHYLVLPIHGVCHHHALVPLVVLQLAKVL